MAVTTTFTLTKAGGKNLFAISPALSKRTLIRRFSDELRALAGGIGGGHGGTQARTTCRYGTAPATGTVTAATVVNANTVTINGTILTATQKHSRGTITPTVSGIDVDDTVTINTTGILTAKQHNAKGTITAATAIAGNTIVVGATTFTGATGAVTLGAATFSVDTGNNQTATSIAAQINAHPVASLIVFASASSAVVTLRALTAGTAGNAIVLTSSGSTVAVSGSGTLSGATAVAANEFDISGTNAQVCTSLAAAINACALLLGVVTAWASATVVTVRAVTAGTGGDAIGLASSDAQLAVSAATLTGGGTVANNVFDFGGSDTETAADLARAINASSTSLVSGHVAASSAAAVVTLTARNSGLAGNAITLASSGSTVAVSGSGRLTGGTETTATF